MSGDPSGLGWQRPGISGPVEQEEDRLILKQQAHTLERGLVIPSDVVDSGGTPTTKLRKGFVLVRVEAAGALQGQFVQFGHASAPATNDVQVATILTHFLSMLDQNQTAVEKGGQGLVHAWVDEDLILFGTADQAFIDKVKEVMTGIIWEAAP